MRVILLIISMLLNLSIANEVGKPFVQMGHSDGVITQLDMSSNGKYLLSVGGSNIRLWDADTKKELKTFNVGYVSHATISADGNYMVFDGGRQGKLSVFDIQNNRLLNQLEGHKEGVTAITFLDNKFVVSSGYDNTLKVWNINTGELFKTFQTKDSITVLSRLNVGSNDINLQGKQTPFITNVYHPENEPSGLYIVSTNELYQKDFKKYRLYCPTLSIRDISGGNMGKARKLKEQASFFEVPEIEHEMVQVCKGDKNLGSKNTLITLFKNKTYLVAGSESNTYILDVTSEQWITQLNKRGFVSGNDKYLIFEKVDNSDMPYSYQLIIWDLELAKSINSVPVLPNPYEDPGVSARITSDGEYLFLADVSNEQTSGSESYHIQLSVWDVNAQKVIEKLSGNSKKVHSISITPDDKYLLLANDESSVKVWDLSEGKMISVSEKHSNSLGEPDVVTTIKVSPDGQYGLSATYGDRPESKDGIAKLWDIKTGVGLKDFQSSHGVIPALSFTQDGKDVIIGASHGIKVFSIESGSEKMGFNDEEMQSGYAFVHHIETIPDSKYVLYEISGKIRLRNIQTGKEIRTFGSNITSFSFLQGSNNVISINNEGVIELWNLDTGVKIKAFNTHKGKFQFQFITVTPDGKYAISGSSDNKLKLWNIAQEKLIRTFNGHNADVTSIVITSDGKRAISGSYDGTTKLWDIESGKELLSMVSFADGEWIAITPEGYFNASENGAKYLNVLTGPMSVTSVDAYYETFYRPDIVKSVLAGKKVDTGLSMADIKPAPEVKIVNTPSKINKDEVKVTLNITEKGGGVGDIRLYLNGVAVKTDSRAIVRKQSKKSIQKHFTLKLPKGKHTIKAMVFNESNTMRSNEAEHTVTAEYQVIHQPELHALIIGVNEFKNPKLQLKYATDDAILFAQTIKEQSKGLFSKTVIHQLDTKAQTTKTAITQKLKELQNLNPDDFFVFYVASHGTVDDGEYFLLTSNVGSTSTSKLKSDAIQQTELKRLIANVPTTKKFIVLDTCNAGAMGDALLTRGMSEDTAMKVLSRAVGSTILAAATSQQEALEGYRGHGLFTYVLAEGLKGKADMDNDGYVKTLEIANYIDEKVPELAESEFNRAQYPVVSPSGQAFPVGRVK